ncbi:MAG: division/cell wall cluster transcriptional repressor MraZ [Erysipelotrichaceae bacterium]
MYFMGEFNHNIDSKGRIVIPSKYREYFNDKVILTRGYDGCLSLYLEEQWLKIIDELNKLPLTNNEVRNYVRLTTAKASDCEIDNQNRILISKSMMSLAQLQKECVFVGANDHLELWAKEKWEEYSNAVNDKYEEVAESVTSFLK